MSIRVDPCQSVCIRGNPRQSAAIRGPPRQSVAYNRTRVTHDGEDTRKRWPGGMWLWLLAIVLGIVNALLLFGREPIDPTNTAWIFGDNATYYFGWALYRHDPHLSFPLAWTDRVGYPAGTSIALLDAIPLAAILLRPLGPLLPEPFQYLGLYSALCFVLQAYFGMRLCTRLFPSQPAAAAIGGVFFLLSAPLTNRAFGHTALLSHWLILAGLDSYFRDPGETPVRWLARLWIVLAIAGGITPYIAFMCFLVALAGVARLLFERRTGWMRTAILLAATAAVLVASLAVFGVLVGRDAETYWAPGYGYLSMNLNAPVNPARHGSILLPTLRVSHPGQHEGYNYLGLGVLALLAVGLVRQPAGLRALGSRRVLPLALLALVCTVLAVSTIVTFGSSTLFTLPLPRPLLAAAHGLRASGRLFWPAYYLIVAGALVLAVRGLKARTAIAVLAAALAVQIADLTPLRTRVRRTLDQRFPSPLQAPAWAGLGRTHDTLVLVPPYQCGPEKSAGGIYSYVTFGKLAAAERMRSNDYYAARYTQAQLTAHCVDLLRTHLHGPLDPRSAYIVTDAVRTVWTLAGVRSHRCERLDNYNLCTAAADAASPPQAAPPAPPYELGRVLDLTEPDARQYLTFGWGDARGTGLWTEGPLAMVRLGLESVDPSRDLMLEVDAQPYVGKRHPRLEVDVVVNGQPIDRWIFESGVPAGLRQVGVPAGLASARRGLDIELRIRNPEAPLYLGEGPSSAFLGLDVRSIAVR